MKILTPEEFEKNYKVAPEQVFADFRRQTTGLQRAGSSLKYSWQDIKNTFAGKGKSEGLVAPVRGFQLAAQTTGAPIKAAVSALLPERAQENIGKIVEPVSKIPSKIGESIKLDDLFSYLIEKHPEVAKTIENITVAAQSGAETVGNLLAYQAVPATIKGVIKNTGKLGDILAEKTIKTAEKVAGATSKARSLVSPLIEEAKAIPGRLSTNLTAKQVTETAIKSLPSKTAQTAVRNGIDLEDVKFITQTPKSIKPQYAKLAKVAKDFSSGKTKTNPFEVVGKPMTQAMKMADKKLGTIGQQLGAAADKLPSFKSSQLFQPVLNRLKKVRGLEGLTASAKGKLNFNNTVLATAGTQADRVAIQKIFLDAIKAGSGKSKHLLRQELFEILGGKKRASLQLTGTQESAYNAIRQGLADVLDASSNGYKALSLSYAKTASPLAKLRKLMGASGFGEDVLDMKAGLLARRLTSFAKSNPEIRQILRELDQVLGTSGKTLLQTEKLQDFYNILDKYYDIAGKTTLQGQVTAGIEKAKDLGDFAMSKLRETAGVTDAVRQKALEDVLSEFLKY